MPAPRDEPTAGTPRARRLWSWATNLLLAGVVLGLLAVFWPTSLGGCSTLTIVSGRSMEPTYVTGDLVWSRCGEAAVGDVVVYAPPDTEGARVIHRIIGGDATEGWVLQGDNNSFVDPWTPDGYRVVGVARAHLPRLGTAVFVVANPYVWGSLLVLAAAISLWPRTADAEEGAAKDGEEGAEGSDGAGREGEDALARTAPSRQPAHPR